MAPCAVILSVTKNPLEADQRGDLRAAQHDTLRKKDCHVGQSPPRNDEVGDIVYGLTGRRSFATLRMTTCKTIAGAFFLNPRTQLPLRQHHGYLFEYPQNNGQSVLLRVHFFEPANTKKEIQCLSTPCIFM